jgi:two-component system, chemotaxis family, protein-glutamate methylesterase/glutaminase
VGAQPRAVVVVGASAGGVDALCAVAAGIPADLPAAVLVVMHLPADEPSTLPAVLDRAGPLPATAAVDGTALLAGHIHVARPDQHLAVTERAVLVLGGAAEHGHRPAINVLFRSAARAWRSAVTAVFLAGTAHDGVDGLVVIARKGGRVIVQDRAWPTLRGLTPDHVVPAAAVGPLLAGPRPVAAGQWAQA